jgi:hypothetical protein
MRGQDLRLFLPSLCPSLARRMLHRQAGRWRSQFLARFEAPFWLAEVPTCLLTFSDEIVWRNRFYPEVRVRLRLFSGSVEWRLTNMIAFSFAFFLQDFQHHHTRNDFPTWD